MSGNLNPQDDRGWKSWTWGKNCDFSTAWRQQVLAAVRLIWKQDMSSALHLLKCCNWSAKN